jgi:prolyl-tRNA editing enzyme YbaK/EbsC (Cys-tRNA(Pro) deacylase)
MKDGSMSRIHIRISVALREHKCIRVIEHAALGREIRSPADFADALGFPVERIAKTVLLANSNLTPEQRFSDPVGQYVAACLSSCSRINFREVSRMQGWPRAELSSREELSNLLDFPPGGVSPFGLGNVPLIFDESLLAYETILVGAGAVGIELEVKPRMLIEIANGMPVEIKI